jgi:hypothetical protein
VLQDAREGLAAVRAGTHTAGLRVLSDSAAAAPARQAHSALQLQRSLPVQKQQQQQQQQQQHERSVPLQQQQQQLLQQQSSGQEPLATASSGSSSSSSSNFPEIKVAWQVGAAVSALSVVPERSRRDHAVLWLALNRKIEWYPTWEPGTKSEMAVAEKVRPMLKRCVRRSRDSQIAAIIAQSTCL